MKSYPLVSSVFLVLYVWSQAFCPTEGMMDCSQVERDIVIIMDESNSINDTEFFSQQSFIKEIIGCFNLSEEAIKLSLVSFARNAFFQFDFNEFVDNVTGAEDYIMNFVRVPDGKAGQTNTDLAFTYVRETLLQPSTGDRSDVTNTIILLTDGQSNSPEDTLLEYFKFDFTQNEFFVIGIGDLLNMTELAIIATDPDVDHLFIPQTFDDLMPLKDTVVQFACPPCDPPCQNNGTCFRPEQSCECPPGTFGPLCDVCGI